MSLTPGGQGLLFTSPPQPLDISIHTGAQKERLAGAEGEGERNTPYTGECHRCHFLPFLLTCRASRAGLTSRAGGSSWPHFHLSTERSQELSKYSRPAWWEHEGLHHPLGEQKLKFFCPLPYPTLSLPQAHSSDLLLLRGHRSQVRSLGQTEILSLVP